ncbi:MAG: hypothetical protein SXG53_27250, partial [Pseudomonadota bacterium]|nr:hypothetical protein [Pseudomonadota bacterium]
PSSEVSGSRGAMCTTLLTLIKSSSTPLIDLSFSFILITDSGADAACIEAIRAQGVDVRLV